MTQLDADAALDVWSISTEARERLTGRVLRGELVHESDDTPPRVMDQIVW